MFRLEADKMEMRCISSEGNYGAEKKFFDSMYRCVGTCTSMQSASLLMSTEDYHIPHIENIQLQEEGVDCDLFAIVFATEFCFGNNPECYR